MKTSITNLYRKSTGDWSKYLSLNIVKYTEEKKKGKKSEITKTFSNINWLIYSFILCNRLKIRRRGNQEWRDVVVTNGTSNFTEKIPGLEKNGDYQFRVDILSRNEKTNITGPPGVPTAFVHVPCISKWTSK